MRRSQFVVVAVTLLLLASCDSSDLPPTDAGAPADAVVDVDAASVDAGPLQDAGPPRDAGPPSSDAGPLGDDGGPPDAGPPPPACVQPRPLGGVPGSGEVRIVSFDSPSMRGNWAFKVYLPPGYPDSGPYPTVYFFHGSYRRPMGVIGGNPLMPADGSTPPTGSRRDFDRLINDGTIPPFVFVSPQAGWDGREQGCFRDRLDPPGSRLGESYIVDELIPYVDANFNTIAGCTGENTARSIEGFSMGSGEAQRHAFKLRGLYSSVVAYGSGLINEDHCGLAATFDEIAAAEAPAIIAAGIGLRLVSGSTDPILRSNNRWRRQLRGLGIPFTYEEVPGVGHNFSGLIGADGVLERSLSFHAGTW